MVDSLKRRMGERFVMRCISLLMLTQVFWGCAQDRTASSAQPLAPKDALMVHADEVATVALEHVKQYDVAFTFNIPHSIGGAYLEDYDLRFPRAYADLKGLTPWILQLVYDIRGSYCINIFVSRKVDGLPPQANVDALRNNAGFVKNKELVSLHTSTPKDAAIARVGDMDVMVIVSKESGVTVEDAFLAMGHPLDK